MQILFSDSMESSKDPEREKFCLKWNEYENNISATFKALRGDDDFADVTLVSDENLQLEVHKIILAASSPFFSSLLRKNKRDDVHPLIYLRGVKDKELKTVVDFMYHGEVNVYQEDLQDFLTVAEELKLRGLRQEVEDVKDHCANGDAASMGRSFGGENEDDMDEVILHPEQNMTGDTDDIADTEESFVENGRVVVEESDDIEEMIDAMMERGADGDWRCVSCGKTAGKYKNNLRKHVEIVHLDQKGKPCKFCGKTFKSRPNLYAHVRRCQQSPQNQIAEQPSMLGFVPHERTEEDTSYGQMVPMDGTELDVNLMIDPEIEAKVTSLMIRQEATGDWICGECGKNSGKLKANLRKHVEAMHVEGFVLPCASCGRTFGYVSTKFSTLHPLNIPGGCFNFFLSGVAMRCSVTPATASHLTSQLPPSSPTLQESPPPASFVKSVTRSSRQSRV